MSNRTRQRVKRGPTGNVLITGDTGNYAGPQSEGPGTTESGKGLESREFGAPQADLPGGVKHLVNPQTIPRKTAPKPERPADYHKYHGVPSDDGPYEVPPDESSELASDRPKPVPESKTVDAVPVYQVEMPGDEKMLRKTIAYNIRVAASTNAMVTRICDRDVRRVKLKVLNEDSSNDIRISSQEEELLTASAQGTGSAGAGALIWHGTNSYTDLEECQDAMYAIVTSANTALLSVLIVTEVPQAGN